MPSIFSPSKNSFETQHVNEKVVLLTMKHWYVLFVPLFFVFVLSIIPFAGLYFVKDFSLYQKFSDVYWFLVSVYFLILWNLAFYKIMLYCLNTVIVTNERVIENRQLGLFKHIVNEVPLDKIQDISVNIFGIIATLLEFGDIEIQTAGTQNKFYFSQLPNPKNIKEIIMKLKSLN